MNFWCFLPVVSQWLSIGPRQGVQNKSQKMQPRLFPDLLVHGNAIPNLEGEKNHLVCENHKKCSILLVHGL